MARIAAGDALMTILREKGMPGYSTVMEWLDADAELADKYARARLASADADADKIGHIAHGVLKGEFDPQAARVAIDALKWSAGKRKPKVYGDKLDVEHKGSFNVTLTGDDAKL